MVLHQDLYFQRKSCFHTYGNVLHVYIYTQIFDIIRFHKQCKGPSLPKAYSWVRTLCFAMGTRG